MTVSRRYTINHFLDYGRRYCIDYRFPDVNAAPTYLPHAAVAIGRVEEHDLMDGMGLFISDLDIKRPYRSCSQGSETLLIVVLLEGRVHFDISGQRRWLTEGEACCLRLTEERTLSALHPANQRLRTLCLSLQKPAINSWCGAFSAKTMSHTWRLSAGLRLALEEGCDRVGSELAQRTQLQGLALQVLAQSMSAQPQQCIAPPLCAYQERLEQVRRWLDEEPLLNHSLARLAEHAAMSPSTLLRHFKLAYGLAPIDYLRKRRLALAKELLMRGHSVQQAAHLSGYRHASNFITAFRKLYGISPGGLCHQAG